MHKVKKKTNGKRIQAWRLGQNSKMERMLRAEGKILQENGTYRLFSLEAVRAGSGVGEEANVGDWFRVEKRNGERFPYPLTAEYFADHYRQVQSARGDEFEPIPKILDAWFADDESPDEEVRYLLDTGKLSVTDDSLVALNWGTTLVAPRKGSAVIFYSVKRLSNGELFIDFNLVDAAAFRRDYDILD